MLLLDFGRLLSHLYWWGVNSSISVTYHRLYSHQLSAFLTVLLISCLGRRARFLMPDPAWIGSLRSPLSVTSSLAKVIIPWRNLARGSPVRAVASP